MFDAPSPSELLHVEVVPLRWGMLLALRGEVDISTVGLLEREIQHAAEVGAARVAVDLRGLTFIDGSGVNTIVSAWRELGERLVLYRGSPRVQRVFVLAGYGEVLPFLGTPQLHAVRVPAESNVEFVRRLWEAYRAGGPEAMLRLVPGDVEWRPSAARGRVLHGSEELRRFWEEAEDPRGRVEVSEFRAVGDDVVIHVIHRLPDGAVKELWSRYEFSQSTLTRAFTFESESDALASVA